MAVDEAEITPGSDLVEDLGADSLDVIEIVMSLEEEFDIEIPDEDVEKFKTLAFRDVLEYLATRVD